MDYKVSENELDKELQDKINNKNATSLNNKKAEDFLLKEDYKKDSAKFALNSNVNQELNSLKSNQTSQTGLIQNNKKEIDTLKSSVDNGKSSLYSAIVGKKVTPRSKDFKDLTEAVNDIKLGKGNAQASEVLAGRTFTNDTGIMQTGSMKNRGNLVVDPSLNDTDYGSGFFSNIKIKGIKNIDESLINEIVKGIKEKYPNKVGKLYAKGEKKTDDGTRCLKVNGLSFKPSIVLIKLCAGEKPLVKDEDKNKLFGAIYWERKFNYVISSGNICSAWFDTTVLCETFKGGFSFQNLEQFVRYQWLAIE